MIKVGDKCKVIYHDNCPTLIGDIGTVTLTAIFPDEKIAVLQFKDGFTLAMNQNDLEKIDDGK